LRHATFSKLFSSILKKGLNFIDFENNQSTSKRKRIN
jgi:hypothetical protein